MKKTLFAKILILVLCMAMVLCGCNKAGSGTGDEEKGQSSGGAQSADKQVTDALGNTLSGIFAGGASTDVLEEAMKTGKITVTYGDQIENVLYINSEKMLFADELKLDMDGVELEAEIYLSENDLIVALPDIVSGAYGVNFNTLMKDLKDSYIWEMAGTDYDSFMEEMEASVGEVEGLLDQLEPLLEGLGTTLESVLNCVDSSVTQGTVTVDGQEVEATIVTYSLGNEELNQMLDIIFDYLEDYTEVVSDLGRETGDMLEDITNAKEEAKAALEEAEVDFKLVTNINPDSGTIMTVDGTLKVILDGEEYILELDGDFGIDAATSDSYTMYITSTEAGVSEEVVAMVLDRSTNGSVTTYDFNLEVEGDEVFTANLEYNSQSGAYELSMEAEGDELIIDGTYKLTEDYFEFSIGSIEADGYAQDIDVKIVIEAISPSEMPKAPSYTNILTMSEAKWMDLAEEIQEFIGY